MPEHPSKNITEMTGKKIIQNKGTLKSQRSNFDTYYQTLHDYFYVEGQNVNRTYYPGTELDFLFLLDSTSLEAADVLAAGIDTYLTPSASKWFVLEHPDPSMRDNKNVRQWMQDVADEIRFVYNRSNFYNQMPIFYKASGVYGTAVMLQESDEKDALRFYTIPVRDALIVEDARERLLENYFIVEYTAEQAFTKFGDQVDTTVKEAMASGRYPDRKFEYVYYLGPRQMKEFGKTDRGNMDYRGAWVETKSAKIMKEEGFNDMPAVAHRFYKRPKIPYGFSPAMKALPWVRMINTMADTMLRAGMKMTDPPIAMPDSGFLAQLDFNPRAVNFYKRGKLDPTKDIAPIGNYGRVEIGMKEIEYYSNQVNRVMFKDAFQSFGQITKQMNNPEVLQRINEAMTLLGPAVGRYMSEVLQPTVERSINLLFRAGRLPPIPEEMMINPSYDVKFTGRLASAQKQGAVNNTLNALQIAGQVATMKPEALDKINVDETIDEIWSSLDAPARMILDNKEVAQIRAAKAKQLQAIQAIEMAQGASKAGKDATAADVNVAKSKQLQEAAA